MVTEPEGGLGAVSGKVLPDTTEVCGVCVPSAGSPSLQHRCPIHGVGLSAGVRLPPQPIMAKVLQKIWSSRCRIILIASALVQQSYYPDLMELSVRPSLKLPQLSDLLSQHLTGVLHQQPDIL